jgi:hypothetical protein
MAIVAIKPIATLRAQITANNMRPTAKTVTARVNARTIATMTLTQKIPG